MSRRQALHSPRSRALRKKRLARFFAVLVFAVLSVAVAVILLLNSYFLRVSSISVSSDDTRLGSSVRTIVSHTISGSYLGLVPKDSALLFPYRALARAVAAQFPQVSSVSFSHGGLSSVTMTLRERMPAEIVCVASDVCYEADEDGVIFKATAATTTGAFLVYDISLPAGADPLGVQFIDAGRLDGFAAFAGGLARLGFAADHISVLPGRQYDLSLGLASRSKSATSSDMHLFIDESRSFPETLNDFSAFWQEHEKTAAAAKENDALSSVDMRYGDNIVYKAL